MFRFGIAKAQYVLLQTWVANYKFVQRKKKLSHGWIWTQYLLLLNVELPHKIQFIALFEIANREARAGYKRGVARPEVLGHAHKHGGQIQTLKKKLHKLNTYAQYTVVAMLQTAT